MLTDQSKIIWILRTLDDYYHLSSNSIIKPSSRGKDPTRRDPFKPGFLSSIEERAAVIKRLSKLEKRKRNLLMLYYTFSKPIKEISKSLNISQRHFYRLRKDALSELIENSGN